MGRDGVVGSLIMSLVCILYCLTTSDSQLGSAHLIFGSGPARVCLITRTSLQRLANRTSKVFPEYHLRSQCHTTQIWILRTRSRGSIWARMPCPNFEQYPRQQELSVNQPSVSNSPDNPFTNEGPTQALQIDPQELGDVWPFLYLVDMWSSASYVVGNIVLY